MQTRRWSRRREDEKTKRSEVARKVNCSGGIKNKPMGTKHEKERLMEHPTSTLLVGLTCLACYLVPGILAPGRALSAYMSLVRRASFSQYRLRPIAPGIQTVKHSIATMLRRWPAVRQRRHIFSAIPINAATDDNKRRLAEHGYVPFSKTPFGVLDHSTVENLRARLPLLFRGEFDTGVYPDEMHWREGISKEEAPREVTMIMTPYTLHSSFEKPAVVIMQTDYLHQPLYYVQRATLWKSTRTVASHPATLLD